MDAEMRKPNFVIPNNETNGNVSSLSMISHTQEHKRQSRFLSEQTNVLNITSQQRPRTGGARPNLKHMLNSFTQAAFKAKATPTGSHFPTFFTSSVIDKTKPKAEQSSSVISSLKAEQKFNKVA